MSDPKQSYSSSYGKSNISHSPAAPAVSRENKFRNDGSFLELFKKMQNAATTQILNTQESLVNPKDVKNIPVHSQAAELLNIHAKSEEEEHHQNYSSHAKPLPLVGRRKSGRALPVGKVKKIKTDDSADNAAKPKDAWSNYLQEVKKYKDTYCESEARNRSLVK